MSKEQHYQTVFEILKQEKVFLITSEFPPQPGGLGHQAASLAFWLQRSGIDIGVVTNSRGLGSEADEKAFDRKASFPIRRASRHRMVAFTYFQRISLVFSQIKCATPMIVMASGKFSIWLAGFLGLFYSHHRYIAILHGSELALNGLSGWLTKFCLGKFEQGIAVSWFTKSLAEKLAPQLIVTVIPNGFEPDRLDYFPGKCPLPGFPALVTVGNVSRRKGQQNIIRALPAILERYPKAHYHIIGIPTERTALESLAMELSVQECTTFHGALPDEELAPHLRGMDIFLMLSESQPDGDVEGFGIAILEANHLGLPAIGANDSGITDAIKDGYSGKLVSPKDTKAIADAVENIMQDYSAYANHAKIWANDFTWAKVIEKYMKLLHEELI